ANSFLTRKLEHSTKRCAREHCRPPDFQACEGAGRGSGGDALLRGDRKQPDTLGRFCEQRNSIAPESRSRLASRVGARAGAHAVLLGSEPRKLDLWPVAPSFGPQSPVRPFLGSAPLLELGRR